MSDSFGPWFVSKAQPYEAFDECRRPKTAGDLEVGGPATLDISVHSAGAYVDRHNWSVRSGSAFHDADRSNRGTLATALSGRVHGDTRALKPLRGTSLPGSREGSRRQGVGSGAKAAETVPTDSSLTNGGGHSGSKEPAPHGLGRTAPADEVVLDRQRAQQQLAPIASMTDLQQEE